MIDSIWKKVIGVAGGLILVNGVLLPWITVEKILDYNIVRIGSLPTAVFDNYAYMMYAQYLSYALVALGFAFILALFIDEKHKITMALAASSFVLSIVIFGWLHAFVSDIRALGGGAQNVFGFHFSSIDIGYGMYMCIIGSILMLGSAFLIWYEGRAAKKKESETGKA